MATLNDSAGDFPDVYQLENGDPLVGGVPNEGTGAGMDNIPHLQLARRTRNLFNRVVALEEGDGGSPATTETPGIVQLEDSVTSVATDKAATPKSVKLANDNANSRVPGAREVQGGGLVTGGGALTSNRTLTVTAASDADAVAGTRADVAMTPKSTKAAIEDAFANAQSSPVLGVGQSWQNVKASRATNTVHQNATGRPIVAAIMGPASGTSVPVQVSTDAVSWITVADLRNGGGDDYETASIIIPPDHYYRVTGAASVQSWAELR